jgi:hypothetical protein
MSASDRNRETGRPEVRQAGDPSTTPDERTVAHRDADTSGSMPPPPSNPKENRSLGSLIGDLTTDTRALVQQEVQLAKTEVSEKVDVLQRNMVFMAVGGAFVLAALLTLVWALSTALTALFAQFMSLEIAVWLAPLVVAVVLGLIGYSLVMKGKETIKDEGMTLDRTADSLRADRKMIKEKVR